MKNHRTEGGYSLMEMLVVLAIIGVLTMVTVPNFINMRKSAIVKGALRQFTNDLRAARQRAVTKSSLVRIVFIAGSRQYYVAESLNNGTTWSGVGNNPRYLAANVFIENGTGASKFTDTVEDTVDGKDLGDLPDIVFERTGVARAPGGNGQVLVKTTYTQIPKPSYTISVRTTGMISTQ